MINGEPPTDDTTELMEIAVVAHRAGLRLSAGELQELVAPYRRSRGLLSSLRAVLDPTDEPAVTFDPTK